MAGGKAVEGATVLLGSKDSDGGALERPGRTPMPLLTHTDSSGRWSLKTSRDDHPLSITKAGFFPRLLSSGEAKETELKPGGWLLAGELRAITGEPIGDADVLVLPLSGSSQGHQWAAYATRSNEAGHFEMSVPSDDYYLIAGHRDFAPSSKLLSVGRHHRSVHLYLTPGAQISGHVLDSDGKPVASALVTVRLDESDTVGASPGSNGFGGGSIATDADGAFLVHSLSPGIAHLRAVKQDQATFEPTLVNLALGDSRKDLTVRMKPAGRVSGTLVRQVSKDGYEPVRDAYVGLRDPLRKLVVSHVQPTDSSGHFELPGITPGYYEASDLSRAMSGFVMGGHDPFVPLRVGTSEIKNLRIESRAHAPGPPLELQLEPPRKAWIRINPRESAILEYLDPSLFGIHETDESGRLVLESVPAGTYEFVARTMKGLAGRTKTKVDEDTKMVRLALETFPTVLGAIHLKEGSDSGRPTLHLWPHRSEPPSSSESYLVPDGHYAVHADEKDRFELLGVPPGSYAVSVSDAKGLLPWTNREHRWAPAQIVIKDAPSDYDLGTLRVERPSRRIEGRIVDRKAQPLVGALVEARSAHNILEGSPPVPLSTWHDRSPAPPQTVTDKNGRFVFEDLRFDTYDLDAHVPGKGLAGGLEEVEVGSKPTITLTTPGSLEVQASIGSQPATQLSVLLSGPQSLRRWFEAHDGRFSIPHIAPGEYRLSIKSNQGSGAAMVLIEEGKPQSLTIKMQAWASLSGQLVDALSGKGLPGQEVSLSKPEEMFSSLDAILEKHDLQAITANDGSFTIENVPPGSHLLSTRKDAISSREVALTGGEAHTLGTLKGWDPESDWEKEVRIRALFIVRTAAQAAERLGTRIQIVEAETTFATPIDEASRTHLWTLHAREEGLAFAAGLREGDRILEVNGYRHDEVGPEVLKGLLGNGELLPDRDYRLRVARGLKEHEIRISQEALQTEARAQEKKREEWAAKERERQQPAAADSP